MDLKSISECERTKLERFLNRVQLPHLYKNIGFGIVITGFLLLITLRFVDHIPYWTKPVIKHAMLVGLLVVSLSREKIEDELIESLRSKSYALAFIIGVIYTLLQPLVNYIVNMILGKNVPLSDIGYIQILLFMLLVQVMFFELLKRGR